MARKLVLIILSICLLVVPLPLFASGFMDDDLPPHDWQQPIGVDAAVETEATGDYWLTTRQHPSRQVGLNIHGYIPMLTPDFGSAYYLVNARIDEVVDFLINDARHMRARSISFYHELYETTSMASLLITASVSSVISRTLVRSINFCPHTGEFLTIHDATDIDLLPLASRILAERMRRTPERFYAAQSISLEDQAFFVNNNGLTILFDEFQLSSMVSETFPLELAYDNIGVAIISSDESRLSDNGYNLIMLPLRSVLEQLGYYIIWNNDLRRVEVWMGDDLVVWMTPNVNEYHTSYFTRSLEDAPLLMPGNITYVPITFFEQILPFTTYSIDEFDNITFVAYLGSVT